MARNFKELRDRMSPERRARSEARAADMAAEMRLSEIRKALEMTQVELAKIAGMTQSEISRIENSADLHLSTLNRVLHAMGARATIHVEWEDGASTELTHLVT